MKLDFKSEFSFKWWHVSKFHVTFTFLTEDFWFSNPIFVPFYPATIFVQQPSCHRVSYFAVVSWFNFMFRSVKQTFLGCLSQLSLLKNFMEGMQFNSVDKSLPCLGSICISNILVYLFSVLLLSCHLYLLSHGG